MSYSFSVTAPSKAEAKEKIAAEFDKVVNGQPVHAFDRAAAQATVEAFVDLLQDPPEGQQYAVSVHGSVSWRGENDFTGASVGVNACITKA